MSRTRVGDQAAVGKVPGKARVGRGNADVALGGKFRPHAHGGAVDGADHGLGALHQGPPAVALFSTATQAALRTGHAGQIRQVCARTERAGHAGHDQYPRVGVFAGGFYGGDELAQHGKAHGVALFGAVDGDLADAVGRVVQDKVTHVCLPVVI